MERVSPTDARADLLTAFADELRSLRARSGKPSYAALQRIDPELRTSTISDALAGRSAPSLDFVLAFVRACRRARDGATATSIEEEPWRSRWLSLERELGAVRRRTVPPPDSGRPVGIRPLETRPRQLPADVRLLVGRRAELAALDRHAREGGTVAVVGEAGVGKTSLVIRWAHENRELFPDGQLFADLRGFSPGPLQTSYAVVQDLLLGLGVPEEEAAGGLDAAAARFRSAVAGRKLLIVLDNALDSEQVRPLLPGDHDGLVVVTSRFGLDSLVVRQGAARLTVGPLAAADAEVLLRDLTGEEDSVTLTTIAAACEHLPLALRIAAERLRSQVTPTAAALAAELTDPRARLDVLSGRDEDESVAVRSVLRWTYPALSEPVGRTFRLMSLNLLPEFPLGAAAALLGVGPAQARRLLSVLSSAHLVQVVGDRFRLHDLLFGLAAELSAEDDTDADRRAAELRLLAWYVHGAARADAAVAPHRARLDSLPDTDGVHPPEFDGPSAARAWCERERDNLAAATARAEEVGANRLAWQLPHLLLTWLNLTKPWSLWIEICTIAARAAARTGDLQARAGAVNALGIAHRELRQLDDAVREFTEAADIYARLDVRRGMALAWGNLGAAEKDRGRHQDALEHYRRAMTVFTEIGDDDGLSIALHNMAEVDLALGDYGAAREHAIGALEISRRLGDLPAVGSSLTTLGEALAGLGSVTEATATFEEALDVRIEVGDRQGAAVVLFRLGRLADRTGASARGGQWLRESLEVFEELGDPLAADVLAYLESA